MPTDECFILSIDGGGIRGVIPAAILGELENCLRRAGKTEPLAGYFHLIAGTSTGGIIAAGLTAPSAEDPTKPAMTAKDLLKLYADRGATIFHRRPFRGLREAFRDFNIAPILQERYDAVPLEAELAAHLGEARLSQALTGVMMTAYDIEARTTVLMTGRTPSCMGCRANDYFFREAARATSAAPAYFEPAPTRNLTQGNTHALVDGGVFANHPAVCAYVEMRQRYQPDQITIVSIGTGYQNRGIAIAKARGWGSIDWINPRHGAPILAILMHGQSSSTDYHLSSLLNEHGKCRRYFRIDGELAAGSERLDDARPQNIARLQERASDIVVKHREDLDEIVQRLKPHGGAPD